MKKRDTKQAKPEIKTKQIKKKGAEKKKSETIERERIWDWE